MAIAFDAVSSVLASSSVSQLTVTHTAAGSDRLALFGVFGGRTNRSVASAKYDGVNGTLPSGGRAYNSSDDWWAEMWRLIAPGTGASVTAEVNLDVAMNNWGFFVITFTGVHQTTPLGTAVNGTGVSSDPSIVVLSETGGLVVDVVANSGAASTAGTGQTQRFQQALSQEGRGMGSEEAGAASVTMSWNNGVRWAQVGVPLKEAGVGGAKNYYGGGNRMNRMGRGIGWRAQRRESGIYEVHAELAA